MARGSGERKTLPLSGEDRSFSNALSWLRWTPIWAKWDPEDNHDLTWAMNILFGVVRGLTLPLSGSSGPKDLLMTAIV